MGNPLAPIGVFDSGVGGLTVARAIIDQLPDEDIIYVGDTGNGPYGPLTIPEIRGHALAIGNDLVDRQIRPHRVAGLADLVRLVGLESVHRVTVLERIHRNGADAHLVGGAECTYRDLTAVGDQDFGDH